MSKSASLLSLLSNVYSKNQYFFFPAGCSKTASAGEPGGEQDRKDLLWGLDWTTVLRGSEKNIMSVYGILIMLLSINSKI